MIKFHVFSSARITTAQKMKFFTKNFASKCDQIRRKVRIWSHLLNKFLMESLIFCPLCCMSFMSKIKQGAEKDISALLFYKNIEIEIPPENNSN